MKPVAVKSGLYIYFDAKDNSQCPKHKMKIYQNTTILFQTAAL